MKKFAIILTAFFFFAACQKENCITLDTLETKSQQAIQSQTMKGKPVLVIDKFGKSDEHYKKLKNRAITSELIAAARGAGKKPPKGPKPIDPQEPTQEPFIKTNTYLKLLDFDGDTTAANSLWNQFAGNQPFKAGISRQTAAEIEQTITIFKRGWAGCDVQITTDERAWNQYPDEYKQRIVFTATSLPQIPWAGGIAWMYGRLMGTGEPAYVFTHMRAFDPNMIAQAGVHEGGHTIGLWHQAFYRGETLASNYSFGSCEEEQYNYTGTPKCTDAPYMGESGFDPDGGEWRSWGRDERGIWVNEFDVLRQYMGYK